MFSKRTSWDFSVNRITELLQKYKANSIPIIDLTESNPTLVGLDYKNVNLLEPFMQSKNFEYHPDPFGLIEARNSIREYYLNKDIQIDSQDILLTTGSSEAYNYIFRLITNPGDEILVPSPSYPLLQILSQINDICIKYYRLLYDGEWHIDIGSIKNNITKRTKILLFIHPNNPTGSYVKFREYEKVLDLIKEKNLTIISDEIFLDFNYEKSNVDSFCKYDDVLTFTINGISKLLGLPQMKLGWIIVNGPTKLKKQALNRLEIISDTFLSVSIPVQNALPFWLNSYNLLRNQIKFRIEENYRFLKQKINHNLPIQLLNIEGGWNAILRLPNYFKDEQWVEIFLNECKIYVQPGYFYDFDFESCVVLSLLLQPDVFKTGVEKLVNQVLKY